MLDLTKQKNIDKLKPKAKKVKQSEPIVYNCVENSKIQVKLGLDLKEKLLNHIRKKYNLKETYTSNDISGKMIINVVLGNEIRYIVSKFLDESS